MRMKGTPLCGLTSGRTVDSHEHESKLFSIEPTVVDFVLQWTSVRLLTLWTAQLYHGFKVDVGTRHAPDNPNSWPPKVHPALAL